MQDVECQNICQIECQNIWQIKCQKGCQIECQVECQMISHRLPDGMSDKMPSIECQNMSNGMPEKMPRILSAYMSDRMSLGGDHSKKVIFVQRDADNYKGPFAR